MLSRPRLGSAWFHFTKQAGQCTCVAPFSPPVLISHFLRSLLLPAPASHRGAGITVRDATFKRTPLHFAALADAERVARLLLQVGVGMVVSWVCAWVLIDLARWRGWICMNAECRSH